MRSPLSAGFVTLLAVTLSRAAAVVHRQVESSPLPYDFIVVGGGTAGSVVASRLSENPKFNVLVLEAGPGEGPPEMEIPFMCNALTPNTPYDWNYTTVPQAGLANREIPYPRGHVMGGSSSINYLIYTRGHAEDYNRYASVTGDPGWSWNKILPLFKRNEKFALPAPYAGRTVFPEYDPSVHGTQGPTGVTLPGYQTSIDARVMQASKELGGEFTFNKDYNSGNSLGLSWLQSTVAGGERSSSATSYLSPTVRQRPNLKVIVGAQVSRILQTGTSGGRPAFRGVEFRLGSSGPLKTLTATKEVILSAGSVGSPHILLNSGIGDAPSLKAIGVKSLVHLPDVGRNMSDHPFGGVAFNVTGKDTFDDFYRNTTLQTILRAEWEATKTGLLVNTLANHLVFSRLPQGHPAFQLEPKDPAAGPKTPHFELLIADGMTFQPLPDGYYLGVGLVILQPSARGTIKLRSNNPFDSPIIDPALLGTPFDKATAREAIRSILRFASAPVWKDYVIGSLHPIIHANSTDGEIDAYNEVATNTLFHPTGTASMSPKTATWGVVDPDLRVKKVSGLRVVDVSVLPYVPSAHTQAPAYVVGERASDLIKAAYP